MTPRTATLFSSPLVWIGDFHCRPTDSGCGCTECAGHDEIAFVRRGMFVRHVGRRAWAANPNHVAFFNRGEEYRISHPVAGGDDCTVFVVHRPVLVAIVAEIDPAAAEGDGRLFPAAEAAADAGAQLLQASIVRAARAGAAVDLAAEEAALDLVRMAVRAAYGRAGGRRPRRAETREAHRDQAEAARRLICSRFAEPIDLATLARAAHASPYHLCRIFRKHTGVSMRAYRHQLRLRTALERLSLGCSDLTQLALDLGYADHSHFSNAFRRAFGLAPAAFRAGRSSRWAREMSKIVQVAAPSPS